MANYEATFIARIPAQTGPPQLVEVGPIKYTSISWMDELTRDGRVDIGVKIDSLDDAIKARLRELDRTPNELWLHRNGRRVAAGPITSYNVQNRRALTMVAPSLTGYLPYMVRDTDYTATSVDQATIVKQLVDAHQAADYGNFGIDTLIPETGVPRDLQLQAGEGKRLDTVIREMGGRENGFDYAIDPTTRRLALYNPRRGADLSDSVFIDRRNVIDAQVSLSVAAGDFATRITAASSAIDGTALTAVAANTDAEARFGRVMAPESFSNISEQTTLDDHAARLADTMSTPAFLSAPTLAPIEELEVGSIAPGDLVTYAYDVGLGAQELVRRISSITVKVGHDGKERLALVFL